MLNTHFSMISQKRDHLEHVLQILFQDNDKVTGYAIRPVVEGKRWDPDHLKDPKSAHLMSWYEKPKPLRMVFFSTPASIHDKDYVPFPFHMDAKGCADFALRWLTEAPYGDEPDTDGHSEKGWHAYTERYGGIDGDWRIFFAVAPEWIIYGK